MTLDELMGKLQEQYPLCYIRKRSKDISVCWKGKYFVYFSAMDDGRIYVDARPPFAFGFPYKTLEEAFADMEWRINKWKKWLL